MKDGEIHSRSTVDGIGARHRNLKARKSIAAFGCYCDYPAITLAMELVMELFQPLRE